MLKRLKTINLMVIASLMLVLTFGAFDRASAQLGPQACPTVPFSTGWITVPVTPLVPPPNVVAGLLGTIEGFGGNAVGGLDWAYNDFSFLNTTRTGSQLASWWSRKNGRSTTLQVTNTNSAFSVAVHVQLLREDCVEVKDFCDFYTPNDTHVYDLANLFSNVGQDISEGVLADHEGTIVVTAVDDCSLPFFYPAIDFDFLQGNTAITDPNIVDYGANVYARFADSSTTEFLCTTLSGDVGCSFVDIAAPPGDGQQLLFKDFNIVGAPAAADLVLLQYADSYGVTYKAVPAFSQFGPFVIFDAVENPESCTPITACFARLGVDDALPVSEDFPGIATPTPTPPPSCDSDDDCTGEGEVCIGAVAGTCSVTTDQACFDDAECPEGETCTGTLGVCGVPTPTPTPTPDEDGGGGGGGCAVAGPVSVGTAMANVILPLIPVAFAFGLGALRRRNRKED